MYDILHFVRLFLEEENNDADSHTIERITQINAVHDGCFNKDGKFNSSHDYLTSRIKQIFPNIVDIKFAIDSDMYKKRKQFSSFYVSQVF